MTAGVLNPTPSLAEAVLSQPHWTIVGVTALLVSAAVYIHFEMLDYLNAHIPRWRLIPRLRILALIIWIMALHIGEIWLFGAGIYLVSAFPQLGHINGADPLMFLDAVYVSATTYTTIGYGDLVPVGPIRFIMGTEALAGFVLLTWSASFTYLEMQRYWRPH